jgi:hypothetical protein
MAFKALDEWDEYFQDIQRIVAHPHATLTEHDRHRAMALIMYMKPSDISLNRYLSRITTDEDRKAIQEISYSLEDLK